MRPIKRIQRNAHPSDACNDGSAVIPIRSERSDSAYNALLSSDTNANASTVRPKEPDWSGFIANAVVERCGSRKDPAHKRMRTEREALNAENVHTADTVSLLRAWARTLCAKCERIHRPHENYEVQNFNFSSLEVAGSDGDRVIALRQAN